MNKQIEALKMAIEALEDWDAGHPICTSDLLQACKEALEQPAQEPVAWRNPNDDDRRHAFMWNTDARDKEKYTVALYTHPAPSWQGLSDDEIEDVWNRNWDIGYKACARAIEQALKEKNS